MLSPTDVELQRQVDLWWEMADKELGIDRYLGRKLPTMFLKAGFDDVHVDITPDHILGGFGGDTEKIWNWDVQLQSVFEFTVKVFGSTEAARLYSERLLELFSHPDVYVYCTLFYVEGKKP